MIIMKVIVIMALMVTMMTMVILIIVMVTAGGDFDGDSGINTYINMNAKAYLFGFLNYL